MVTPGEQRLYDSASNGRGGGQLQPLRNDSAVACRSRGMSGTPPTQGLLQLRGSVRHVRSTGDSQTQVNIRIHLYLFKIGVTASSCTRRASGIRLRK